MEQSLVLPMTQARVRIELRSPNWWEWTLLATGVGITLGADDLKVIERRVLDRLLNGGEPSGEIDGHQVWWVLALSERHYTVYCAADGPDRLLYFQDGEGRLVWRDRLSPHHLGRWAELLGGRAHEA